MAKAKKLVVNVYDRRTFTLDDVDTKYYNCPNIRCINSFGHNVKEMQDKCQDCGAKLDWKYLKRK